MHLDADLAEEEVLLASQGWGLARTPDTEGDTFAIRIEVENALVAGSVAVDGPEALKCVIPAGGGEVEACLAGKCRIRWACYASLAVKSIR